MTALAILLRLKLVLGEGDIYRKGGMTGIIVGGL